MASVLAGGCGRQEQVCTRDEQPRREKKEHAARATDGVRPSPREAEATSDGVITRAEEFRRVLEHIAARRTVQVPAEAMMEMIQDMPYDAAREQVWEYARSCASFEEAYCVASSLWERAGTVNERHEAMVILGYAALWHKEYARGIGHLQTIVQEQLEQKEPSARHLVGAYQHLSTLYVQERKWAESVAAAEAALTWWEREAPERRTCRRAGVEGTLVEALANAGRYAEAEERLQRMLDAGEVEPTAYSGVLKQIQSYRAAPEMRDWSRPLWDVSY